MIDTKEKKQVLGMAKEKVYPAPEKFIVAYIDHASDERISSFDDIQTAMRWYENIKSWIPNVRHAWLAKIEYEWHYD
jgi:hypothetical protein